MPVVFIAENVIDAHLCKQMLEESGIPARVEGEILWQARGDLPPNESTNPTVFVADEHAEQARLLVLELEDHLRDRKSEGEWTCPECNEPNPLSFDVCWNCSHERDPASAKS